MSGGEMNNLQLSVMDQCVCFAGRTHAMFMGGVGVAAAIALSGKPSTTCSIVTLCTTAIGAGYATAHSAKGIGDAWVRNQTLGMRALLPVVMAGIIGIYGLVVGVVIAQRLGGPNYSAYM